MIDGPTRERVERYLRGELRGEEAREFEASLREDAALCESVLQLIASGNYPPRASILAGPGQPPADAASAGERPRVLPEPAESRFDRGGFPYWLPWLFAACLGALCIALLVQNQAAQRQASGAQEEAEDVGQHSERLRLEHELTLRAIAAFHSTSTNDGLRIAVLRPAPAAAAKALAIAVWSRDRGLLLTEDLEAPLTEQLHALWAQDGSNRWHALGALRSDSQGPYRFEFKSPAAIAGKFVISLEVKEGTGQPQGPILLTTE